MAKKKPAAPPAPPAAPPAVAPVPPAVAAPSGTANAGVKESSISRRAREISRVPVDVEEAKKRPTKNVRLRAVKLGFDGVQRIRPGAVFNFDAPLDEEGNVILPKWAVLEHEYVPEEEVQLPPGMQPKVHGRVSQGGLKPSL